MEIANREQRVFNFCSSEDSLSSSIRLVTMREIFAPDYFDRLAMIRREISSNTPYIIAVSDSSVSGRRLSNLFGSHLASQGLALITTNSVPDVIVPSDKLVSYFIYYFARYTLSFVFPELRNHDDTRNCVFDRKICKHDLVKSMAAHALCDGCRTAMLSDPKGLSAATKVDALDRLFMLSGDLLRSK